MIHLTMRQFYIFLLSLLLSTACSSGVDVNNTLADVESLVEQNVDSAQQMLSDLQPHIVKATEDQRALYGLLLTECQYRLYQDNPDSLLPVIRSSEDYFQLTDDRLHLLRAIYYHAMMLFKMQQHDQAVYHLKKGVLMAEDLKDSIFLSKYYESLCMINDFSGNNTLMLQYARKFLHLSLLQHDSECIIRALSDMSIAFSRLGMQDSAYNNTIRILPIIDKVADDDKTYILTNIACDFLENHEVARAKDLLMKSLSIKPKSNTLSLLGDVAMIEGDSAKAFYYWQSSMDGATHNVKNMTFRQMIKAVEKNEKTLAFVDSILTLQDSFYQSSEKAKLYEIQTKYDNEVIINRTYRIVVIALTLVIVSLLAALVLWRWFKDKIKKMRFELVTKEESIRRIENEISILRKTNKDNERKMALLQEKVNEKRKEMNVQIMAGKKIYENIKEAEKMPLSKDDELCLIEYFCSVENDTYRKWQKDYNNLSRRNMVYLILIQMGLSDKRIAELLCISPNAIRTAKSRLKSSFRNNSQAN